MDPRATDCINPACVYIVIVHNGETEAFFKVGVSTRIETRVPSIQTGCPLPIEHVLHLSVPDEAVAYRIEKSLHGELEAFHTSGEWFRFDLSSQAQKDAFKLACSTAIGRHMSGWKWALFTVPEVIQFGSSLTARWRVKHRLDTADMVWAASYDAADRVAKGLSPNFWRK